MIYFLVASAFLFVVIKLLFKNRDDKIITEIRSQWARKKIKNRNIDLIGKYAASNKSGGKYHTLSSQTLKDIDIESLFAILDRTNTGIGQQILFDKILHPTNNLKHLNEINQHSNYFKNEILKREATEKILYRLEQNGTYRIADLFVLTASNNRVNTTLYKYLTGIAVAAILCLAFVPIITIALIPVFAINIAIHYIFKNRNDATYKLVAEAYGLVEAARRLERLDTCINATSIAQQVQVLRPFVNSYRYLNLGIPGDDLSKALFYLVDLVKGALLIDVHLLNKAYSELLNKNDSLEVLYKIIGEFDVSISIASLKSDVLLNTCSPVLVSENKILNFTEAIHPLIEDCVPNSFSLTDKSAFITGSNMSGKSTFLRMILINSILAQTLFICFAKSFSSTFLKSFSSIKIDDDLLEGSSYFFKEVEIMKHMVDQISLPVNNLFIIDEVFKGTNTAERISLAKALLHYLNNPANIVIASSHDLELIQLLSADFEMFHFTETIKDNLLHFDHTIKPGPLKTTNAIKIIEMEKFPQAIIDEAYEMTKAFKSANLSPGVNMI